MVLKTSDLTLDAFDKLPTEGDAVSCFQHPRLPSSAAGVNARAACNQAALQTLYKQMASSLQVVMGLMVFHLACAESSILRADIHTSHL